jgi:hypothetical protein
LARFCCCCSRPDALPISRAHYTLPHELIEGLVEAQGFGRNGLGRTCLLGLGHFRHFQAATGVGTQTEDHPRARGRLKHLDFGSSDQPCRVKAGIEPQDLLHAHAVALGDREQGVA